MPGPFAVGLVVVRAGWEVAATVADELAFALVHRRAAVGAGQDDDSDEESGDEDSEDQESENHGQCVSGVAQGDETGENGTHGWAVSLAARVTCWLEALADESGDEDSDESEDTDVTAATADRPHGKSEAAHQRKADRGSGKPIWAGANAPGTHGHGAGHGKGGNH